jgi:hypothetical protein
MTTLLEEEKETKIAKFDFLAKVEHLLEMLLQGYLFFFYFFFDK